MEAVPITDLEPGDWFSFNPLNEDADYAIWEFKGWILDGGSFKATCIHPGLLDWTKGKRTTIRISMHQTVVKHTGNFVPLHPKVVKHTERQEQKERQMQGSVDYLLNQMAQQLQEHEEQVALAIIESNNSVDS